MAIKDATITIKGDQATVRKVEIMKDKDGNFRIAVFGESKTSDGKDIGLEPAVVTRPAANAVLTAVWDAALPILRTDNGLE